jgi:hypothetical protein
VGSAQGGLTPILSKVTAAQVVRISFPPLPAKTAAHSKAGDFAFRP